MTRGAGARPTRPLLTRRVGWLLRDAARWSYPANSGVPIPVPAPDWLPPAADDEHLAEARIHIAALARWLAPVADPEWLGERITALVAHAWVPDMDEAAMAMFLADWHTDLERFPKRTIEAMAAELRAGDRRGITLAAAIAVCTRIDAHARFELDALRRAVDPAAQARARARLEERLAEDRREADRLAFHAANPDWRANPNWKPLGDAARRALAVRPESE
jgi:hypothetical protein